MIWFGNLSTEVKKYDFISNYSGFQQSGHEYEVTVSIVYDRNRKEIYVNYFVIIYINFTQLS